MIKKIMLLSFLLCTMLDLKSSDIWNFEKNPEFMGLLLANKLKYVLKINNDT